MLIDTRTMLAFGGGHIKGALNIGHSPMASIWAGWLLEPDEPILLVIDDDSKIDEVVKPYLRTGYTKFAGYLAGGMKAWDNAGFELEEVGQMTVHEVKEAGSRLQVVDVRSPSEWEDGHVPGARYLFLPELRKKIGELDTTKPTAVYCDSGYRASMGRASSSRKASSASAIFPEAGRRWKKAKYSIEGGDGK